MDAILYFYNENRLLPRGITITASDSDSEELSEPEDEMSMLETLAEHESEESAFVAKDKPVEDSKPALSGKMQMVLAKLQKTARSERENLPAEEDEGSVLDSLQTLLNKEAPKPVLPWAGADDADIGEDNADPNAGGSHKPKKNKLLKKNTKTANKKKEKEAKNKMEKEPKSKKVSAVSLYKPGEYKQARLDYMSDLKEQGWSHAEAIAEWNASTERADLLAGLSHSDVDFLHLFAGDDSVGTSLREDGGFSGMSFELEKDPMAFGLMSALNEARRMKKNVFKGYLYMCKFGGPSLKRHLIVSNCSGLVASLVCK
ncbi:unnamed protein product, partial [Symbiodinium microadriaticum]